MSRHEMILACRNKILEELALAESSATSAIRADHVYNAASWSERADVLQRIDNSFNKRAALDAAEGERAEVADGSTRPEPNSLG